MHTGFFRRLLKSIISPIEQWYMLTFLLCRLSFEVVFVYQAKGELNRVFPIERITYIFVASENDGELLSKYHLESLDQFWRKMTHLKVPRSLAQDASLPGDISIMSDWLLQNDPDQLRFDPSFSSANSTKVQSADFIRLEDVCIKNSDGSCKMTNPLELYTSPNLWGVPLRTSRYPTYINFKTAKGYRIDSLLGGIVKETHGSTTTVYNATAAAFRLDLNGNLDKVVDSAAFEQGLIAVVENVRLPGLNLYVRAERSLSDELALSCQLHGDDLIMLACAAAFVFVFTVVMNSSCDWYRTKWFPAAIGVITTLMAYGGGVGLCHLLGLKHVPPSESTPFILLGIGVDDVFVITNAYSLTYLHSQDSRTRIGLSLRDAGISVTITTVTNILAFMVGATSVYYSIRVFCIVTAAGLIAGYILCLTLFLAVLSLHSMREQKYRSVPISESSDSSLAVGVTPKQTIATPSAILSNKSENESENGSGNVELNEMKLTEIELTETTDCSVLGHHKNRSSDYFPSTDSYTEISTKLGEDSESPASRFNSSTRPQTPEILPSKDDSKHVGTAKNVSLGFALQRGSYNKIRSGEEDTSTRSLEFISRDSPQNISPPSGTASSRSAPSFERPNSNMTPRLLLPIHNSDDDDKETPKSCRWTGSAKKRKSPEQRARLPHSVRSGYFAIEELENHLVVAERVAEVYKKRNRTKKGDETKVESDKNESHDCHEVISGTVEMVSLENHEEGGMPTSSVNQLTKSQNPDHGIRYPQSSIRLVENLTIQNPSTTQMNRIIQSSPINSIDDLTPVRPSDDVKPNEMRFDVSSMPRLVQVQHQLVPLESINFREPYGTVGHGPRCFFMHYYGPFLMHPLVKIIVLVSFFGLLAFSIYNSLFVEAGLKVREITPFNSYLRDFYDIREKYFAAYGDECVVFFPDGGRWWDEDIQRGILNLTESLRSSDNVVFVMSGLEDFLSIVQSNGTVGSEVSVKMERKTEEQRREEFMHSLKAFLKTPRGSPYATMFTINEDNVLTSWKFYYWLKFQDNTRVAISWFQEAQHLLKDAENKGLFKGHVFTPLAVMWESDPVILRATLSNMIVALISMGVIASLMIPDFKSGLLVLLVIVMIDLDVYAFMPVWDLNLNMLTMVNLVLSIGFAVDYTAHITHCFNHCKGKTRNHRVIETLLLMGLPVTEGMISTYAAVGVLSFAHKYALIVVFRMTTLVLAFAFVHGVILMPVILSLIGPMVPREIDVAEIRDGVVVSTWTVDGSTGAVLKHISHHTKERHEWISQNVN